MSTYQMVKTENYGVGTKTYKQKKTISGDLLLGSQEELPAAKNGTLSVRTSASVGTLTMAAGHGITTGARLDLYWAGGCRRGVVVGTVATNSVPITGGAGTDLPVATTVITAMVPLRKTVGFVGDNVLSLSCGAEANAQVTLVDNADAELAAVVMTPDSAGDAAFSWDPDNGYTNPLAGDTVDGFFLSHGDSTAARKVGCSILLP